MYKLGGTYDPVLEERYKHLIGKKRIIVIDNKGKRKILRVYGKNYPISKVMRSMGQLWRWNRKKYKKMILEVFDGAYNLSNPYQWDERTMFIREGG